MLTRDLYIAFLEKRASEESSIPPNDSAAATTDEFESNQKDQNAFLHANFSRASSVQAQQTAEAKKIWSDVDGKKISGNPLMKVAMRNVFNNAVYNTHILKEASPIHCEMAFQSFCDELEKIAYSRI